MVNKILSYVTPGNSVNRGLNSKSVKNMIIELLIILLSNWFIIHNDLNDFSTPVLKGDW